MQIRRAVCSGFEPAISAYCVRNETSRRNAQTQVHAIAVQHSTAQPSRADLRFASEGQQVVHVVNAKQLAKALEDNWAVVLPLEVAAVVTA